MTSEIATYDFPGTGSYVSVCPSRDNDASNKFQRRYVVLRDGETLKCYIWVTTLSCLLLTADQGWTTLVRRVLSSVHAFSVPACPALIVTAVTAHAGGVRQRWHYISFQFI